MFGKMHLQIFIALTVLVCLSEQLAKFKNCPDEVVNDPTYKNGCAYIQCVGTDRKSMLPCGLISCNSDEDVIFEGNDKVYPDCCPRCNHTR